MKLIIKAEKKCLILEVGYFELNLSNVSIDGSIAGNPAVCTIYGDKEQLSNCFKYIMGAIENELKGVLLELNLEDSNIEINIGADDLFQVEVNLGDEKEGDKK